MTHPSTAHRALLALALPLALGTLAGCTSVPSRDSGSAVDSRIARSPIYGSYQTVTGSRIARRVTSTGDANTGTYVQSISEEELHRMPGTLLIDKLNGGVRR